MPKLLLLKNKCIVVFTILLVLAGVVFPGAVGGPKNFTLKAYYGNHVKAEIEYEGGKVAHLAVSGWECGSVRIVDHNGNVVRSGRMKFNKEEDACLYDADEFTPPSTAKYTVSVFHDDREGSNYGVFRVETN